MFHVVELSSQQGQEIFVFFLSQQKESCVFAVFFAPIAEKGIPNFIAHGSIIQVFMVLEPRILHHDNRARQVGGVGDQPLLTGMSELLRWHSLWGTR